MPTDREIAVLEAQVQAFVAFLPGTLHPEGVPLELTGAVTKDPVPFAQKGALAFRPFREGEVWGHKWESGWFRVRGTVPRHWKGKTVVARLKFGGEACAVTATPHASPSTSESRIRTQLEGTPIARALQRSHITHLGKLARAAKSAREHGRCTGPIGCCAGVQIEHVLARSSVARRVGDSDAVRRVSGW